MGSVQRRVDILGVRGVRRCGPTVKYGKSVADFEGRRHRDPNMEQLSIIDPSFTLEYRTRGTSDNGGYTDEANNDSTRQRT